jgi:hypothetical protein
MVEQYGLKIELTMCSTVKTETEWKMCTKVLTEKDLKICSKQ